MSRTYIPIAERRFVRERARFRCEHYLIHEDDTGYGDEAPLFGCEVDHIIAEKHGGETMSGNLAYACAVCNRSKGSDVASVSRAGVITRLFNSRADEWNDHFLIAGDQLITQTSEAEATDRILLFNTPERCEERRGLQALGRYPLRNENPSS